jgi:hypothetical protein
MFSADKNKETALVKSEQPLKTKSQVVTADSKKLLTHLFKFKVAPDCNNLIASFLGNENKAIARDARICRFLYHDTKAILDVRKREALAHYAVVEPNEDKVTAILTSDPTLINFVTTKIIDNSGRELIDNTVFQLVYGAGDPEMCLAIKPFFEKIYGSEKAGIEEMEKQRKQKFAEDKKADEKQDKQAKDLMQGLLNTVIAAITAEQFNLGKDANNKLILSAATLAAIETFRTKFDKSQPKRIEKGMHFRSNTLLETYNAYVEAAAQWNYDYNKCALFEDGVLSSVLFYAPANDAQRFSQGLYYLQDQKPSEKFTRSLALRIGKNNFYLVVGGLSLDFSLSGSSVDIDRGTRGRGRVGWRAFTNLMSNKNSLLAELMQRVAHRPKSQCVIC